MQTTTRFLPSTTARAWVIVAVLALLLGMVPVGAIAQGTPAGSPVDPIWSLVPGEAAAAIAINADPASPQWRAAAELLDTAGLEDVVYGAINQLSLHLDRILTVREVEQDRFRSIVNSMSQAVFLMDPGLRILQSNPAATRMLEGLGCRRADSGTARCRSVAQISRLAPGIHRTSAAPRSLRWRASTNRWSERRLR